MEDQSTTPLLPCPFCGDTPEMRHTKTWDYFVKCPTCGASTRRYHENERGAVFGWNQRSTLANECRFCAHFAITDTFSFCAFVHQKREPGDYCSKWTEKSWV